MTMLPTFFIPHGGGPWPFMEFPPEFKHGNDALAVFLRSLLASVTERPRALLIVSGHWETAQPALTNTARNTLLFDYSGFPPNTYRLEYPAPGSPPLAARVRALLAEAGFASDDDAARGLDHGAFIPLMLVAPDATIPIVQLSLVEGLDPRTHLALGDALKPLRDEGVLIVGSGMSYHNMRGLGGNPAGAAEFDAWLQASATAEATERNERLATWSAAPGARLAHPREEHLLPLMVAAGAAGDDRGTVVFNETVLGAPISGFRFG